MRRCPINVTIRDQWIACMFVSGKPERSLSRGPVRIGRDFAILGPEGDGSGGGCTGLEDKM
jgi:hypothetical protein